MSLTLQDALPPDDGRDRRITVEHLLGESLARDLGQQFLAEVSVDNLNYVRRDAALRGISPSSSLNMIITAFRVHGMRVKGIRGRC